MRFEGGIVPLDLNYLLEHKSFLMRNRLSNKELKDGILKGEPLFLGKGITLVESTLNADIQSAEELINDLIPYSGKSFRIAITGVPGAGKSTLIEALGKHLTSLNKKVAVLAVDPSSGITQGSILGDKTRMEELSKDKLAFIRPSPSGKSITGITKSTRQSIVLCEAAGYEIIIVETVGVGQIETLVHNMVDLLVLVTLTGAGDELQMIKKGILEFAEIIVVNKADGKNAELAKQTAKEMEYSLKDFKESSPGWNTRVLTVSSSKKKGIDILWNTIGDYFLKVQSSGYLAQNRALQNIAWMKDEIKEKLEYNFWNSNTIKEIENSLIKKVHAGEISSQKAAGMLFEAYRKARD